LTRAFAQNPHFVGQPTRAVNNQGDLVCSGKIAGLGSATEVEAFLEADISATFVCINPAGNIAPGQTDIANVPGEEATLAVRSGQTVFRNLTVPAPEEFDCPNPKWQGRLQSITFSNVSIFVESTELPIPGTFSRTF
jgi:hypothetical protein